MLSRRQNMIWEVKKPLYPTDSNNRKLYLTGLMGQVKKDTWNELVCKIIWHDLNRQRREDKNSDEK